VTAAALQATAQDWLARGRGATVVEVVAQRGSVPRECGARMLVAADAVAGSVGGGHLEWQAIARARSGAAGDWTAALGPALGQCCGGVVTLRFAPLDAAALQAWPQPLPRFALQLHGAGHVGQAVARLLADIDCRVLWVDARDAVFPAGLPPHIECCSSDAPEAEVAAAAPGSAYLVLTHSHALDLRIVEAVLRRGDFGFLGLIGSASKRGRFASRLRQRGFAPELLERLHCPVGVPGIHGKQPAVLAIAVVAQLLQLSA
jgi:xanthine dehydrogenase accessory factor